MASRWRRYARRFKAAAIALSCCTQNEKQAEYQAMPPAP
jgi:hypothetical protein